MQTQQTQQAQQSQQTQPFDSALFPILLGPAGPSRCDTSIERFASALTRRLEPLPIAARRRAFRAVDHVPLAMGCGLEHLRTVHINGLILEPEPDEIGFFRDPAGAMWRVCMDESGDISFASHDYVD